MSYVLFLAGLIDLEDDLYFREYILIQVLHMKCKQGLQTVSIATCHIWDFLEESLFKKCNALYKLVLSDPAKLWP